MHKQYKIGPAESFDQENYREIREEIGQVNKKIKNYPAPFKTEIILSFLKDHSILIKWIEANPELSNMVSSRSLSADNIESLFDSCRSHPGFKKGLEEYLTGELNSGL